MKTSYTDIFNKIVDSELRRSMNRQLRMKEVSAIALPEVEIVKLSVTKTSQDTATVKELWTD